MDKWIKTDTAAVMFTALQTKKHSRIIRESVELKDIEIDEAVLRQAVEAVLPKFPSFCRKLRKGFFWGILEYTDRPPLILPDTEVPAKPQWISRAEGGPEFRVLFSKHGIAGEASHVLCDGHGLLQLLKAITASYLASCGCDMTDCEALTNFDETAGENAYVRYFTSEKLPTVKREPSYCFTESPEPGYLEFVTGLMEAYEVKEKSRKRGLTVTEYFCAAMILAVIRSAKKPIDDAVTIAVPVNMRKFFPSETLRNFSTDFPVVFHPDGRSDFTLDEVAQSVKGQLKSMITKENIQAFLNSSYSMTLKPALRAIPGFIKWPLLRCIQKHQHRKEMTVMISNLGNIVMPESLSDRISRFDFIGGDPKAYGLTKFCSAASINGLLTFCFSSNNRNRALSDAFFAVLTQDGVKVTQQVSGGEIKDKPKYRRQGFTPVPWKVFFNI